MEKNQHLDFSPAVHRIRGEKWLRPSQEITVEIETGNVAGHMGPRVVALVQEWREMHKAELLADWKLAEQKKALHRIAPLE